MLWVNLYKKTLDEFRMIIRASEIEEIILASEPSIDLFGNAADLVEIQKMDEFNFDMQFGKILETK